ncbi:MAG: hypothetical protein LKJ50_04715 [Clostridiales bacterium]|jgi:hypothetical protein|nr:hypothetical protein [Clostridiales bacterium]MCI1961242.1 hypothetical protein [Clostridiales bacterium]MCI2021683.1 hypothetical protein [Clostridiales bacterium]MCI2026469.1 hypothetical protein [Clostridiales bacterium]
MKILDQQGNEILNPDLEKGHLESDKLTIHHDAVTEVPEQSHIEVLNTYPNGGKDVEKVIDVPAIVGHDAYDEYENIQRYILYTAEELAAIEKQKNTPTIPDRLAAVEELLLSQMMGGNAS